VLALDVGDRRIGVARSDPLGILATPLEVYQRESSLEDARHIRQLMNREEASKVVVGLPVNMNGSEGPQAVKTREFAALLEENGISVVFWDERLSTVEAERRLIETKRRRKLPRYIDAEAAALILQSYLDYGARRLNLA
jgi:putative holliday junction resolvase